MTTEELVPEEELRREPERNPVPFSIVKQVCPVPFGAHPYAVYNYYDYDPLQLKEYHQSARDDQTFQMYLEKYVLGVRNHGEYLEAVGGQARLEGLRAQAGYGYSPDLKRRRL